MNRNAPAGLFFTGTDTNVGKTYAAALVAAYFVRRGLRVGVYKPAASGCRREGDDLVSDDALALWHAAGRPGALEEVCPQRFVAALAPHLAAKGEGQSIDAALLRSGIEPWRARSDFVIVEGAGGLMSPISDVDFVRDVAIDLGYPLVIVAADRIGVINQTVQTIIAWRAASTLPIAGIVLNEVAPPSPEDPSPAANRAELARWCDVPILARIGHGETELREIEGFARLLGDRL